MTESRTHSGGDVEPHQEERDETREALIEAVKEHETDEIPGGAEVGAVLTTANENVEYRLTFVLETLLQLMAEGALYESEDGQLRPTDPKLVTDGGQSGQRPASIARMHVLGATVWAYGAGGARVRPWISSGDLSRFWRAVR